MTSSPDGKARLLSRSSRTAAVELSASEKRVLTDILRCVKSEERFHRRARAVLLSAEGRSIRSIAAELGTCRSRVRGWLQRFQEHRLEGLGEAGRPGRPAKFTPHLRQQILEIALRSPRDFGLRRDRWTGESLRATILEQGWTQSISQSSIWRVLSEADVRLDNGLPQRWEDQDAALEPTLQELAEVFEAPGEPRASLLSFGVKSLTKYRRMVAWGTSEQPEPPAYVVACLDIQRKRVHSQCLVRRNDPALHSFWQGLLGPRQESRPHVFVDAQDERLISETLDPELHPNLHVMPAQHSWLNRIQPWFTSLDVSLRSAASNGRRGCLHRAIATFTTNWNLRASH